MARLSVGFISRALLCCLLTSVASAEPVESVPKICIGYDPTTKVWGMPQADAEKRRVCSPHQALFSVTRHWTIQGPAHEIGIAGVCCPLPSTDILTDEHIWVDVTCPNQMVVTGYEEGSTKADNRFSTQLRCTAINTNRYHLGPLQTGAFWGLGSTAALPWKEDTRLLRSAVPVAIRYGVERFYEDIQIYRGCVGQPVGSLFVGKTGRACKHMQFRELYWNTQARPASTPDSPPTPVRMIPECKQLKDIFSEAPECIQ